MTQNNLGSALKTLGEREDAKGRLEEAVAAFRSALQEYTRERVPPDWAMTQNNLGTALMALGNRESGTARLREAVAAFRAALEEDTQERAPWHFGRTTSNLEMALGILGERERGQENDPPSASQHVRAKRRPTASSVRKRNPKRHI